MYERKLPDLGEGIHEAEILKWHVVPGDRISEDAPLVDVETDKAAVTIPSPKAGQLTKVVGEPGDTIVVGQVIAVIDDGSGAALAEPGGDEKRVAPAGEDKVTSPSSVPSAPAVPPAGTKAPAAPATRKLARDLGIDINAVRGTGPAGRVTPEDVRSHAHGKPAAATPAGARSGTVVPDIPFYSPEPMPDFERWGPVEREQVRSIRRKIAKKMVTSAVVVPRVIHMDEADVTDLEAFRRGRKELRPEEPPLSLLSFVVKAVVASLKKVPQLNSSLDPDRNELVYKRYYNVGLAADTPKGLVVPVVKNADRLSVVEVAAEIRRLADVARSGEIAVEDLQGGTFTITNIGPIGGIPLAPAINYPEVAILGMGLAQDKPVVRKGEIVVRKMLPLTLAFDHRVADGADAARFVTRIARLLGDKDELLLEV